MLYIVFFIPGIAALVYAGQPHDAGDFSLPGGNSRNVTAEGSAGLPLQVDDFPGRSPVTLQGIAEIVRCLVCLRRVNGQRLKDVAGMDVVEEQLAHSEQSEASRKIAIERAHELDDRAARQRGKGRDLNK